MLLLDPVHLPPLVEPPERVQAANSGVKRPTQVFLARDAVAQRRSIARGLAVPRQFGKGSMDARHIS